MEHTIDGLVQDCRNSSELAMELLQSFNKSTISFRTRVQQNIIYDVVVRSEIVI